MTATMTTGGRGITAERAVQAKQAGLISASVSIDGIAETHDRLRGVQGSFASALAALKHLRNAGVQVSVNTQINRLSMPQLFDVLDILAEHQAHAWQLQLTVPMGRATDEPEVLLQPQDLLSLFPLLAELKERASQLGVRVFPGNNIGYFGPHESKLRDFMVRKHSSSCMAGQLTLGIEADGSIKGCPSLPTENWVGGNVRDASLRDIWERSTPLRYTRDRSVDDLWGYCRDCYYADVCLAGCTWTSDVFFGRPGNNPYCHHRALEFDKRGLRERLVRTTTAPGQPFDQGGFEYRHRKRNGSGCAFPTRSRAWCNWRLCEQCERHVRHSESVCPFCQAELAPQPLDLRQRIAGQLSRAQRFAAAMSMAAAPLAGCSETTSIPVSPNSGGSVSTTGGAQSTGGTFATGGAQETGGFIAVPAYGLPLTGGFIAVPPYGIAPTGGTSSVDASVPDADTPDSGEDAGAVVLPVYGLPPYGIPPGT